MSTTLSTASLNKWVSRTTNDNQAVQFNQPEAPAVLNGRRVGRPVPPGRNAAATFLTVANRTCTGRDAKVANEFARQQFLGYIFKQCNVSREMGMAALPENVRTAMKLNGGFIERHDWDVGKSRPLTARRIRAVMAAIVDYKAMCGMFSGPSLNTAKLIWNTFKAKDFWSGLDQGLRGKLLKSTVVRPPKNADEKPFWNPVLAGLRQAFMEGSHRLTKTQWLSAVNAAYRENPNGKIQIDVETGTVTFV